MHTRLAIAAVMIKTANGNEQRVHLATQRLHPRDRASAAIRLVVGMRRDDEYALPRKKIVTHVHANEVEGFRPLVTGPKAMMRNRDRQSR
jgi:hypothetical protein